MAAARRNHVKRVPPHRTRHAARHHPATAAAAAAAAAAASGVWLTTATEQATRSLLSDPDPHPSPDT